MTMKQCECCGRYRHSSSEHFICSVCGIFCKNKKSCSCNPTVINDVLGIHKVCVYYNKNDENKDDDIGYIHKCNDCYNLDDIDEQYFDSMSFDEFLKTEKIKYRFFNNIKFCTTYREFVDNDMCCTIH